MRSTVCEEQQLSSLEPVTSEAKHASIGVSGPFGSTGDSVINNCREIPSDVLSVQFNVEKIVLRTPFKKVLLAVNKSHKQKTHLIDCFGASHLFPVLILASHCFPVLVLIRSHFLVNRLLTDHCDWSRWC